MVLIPKITIFGLFLFIIGSECVCLDESIDNLLDNHDMIYQMFPTSPRHPSPLQSATLDAGTCCLSFTEVEVPVGVSAKFTSPNYPGKYPSDMDCGWNFTTDAGYLFDMRCHFKHLKRNDYLDMQENNDLYSYVENVKEQNMVHYFWSNEVTVGFHSDQETGVDGFECEIWPVSQCSNPPVVTDSTPRRILTYGEIAIEYDDSDYTLQKITCPVVHPNQPCGTVPSDTDAIEPHTIKDWELALIDDLFIICFAEDDICYPINPDGSSNWTVDATVPNYSYNFLFVVSGKALFVDESQKRIRELSQNFDLIDYAYPWDDWKFYSMVTDGERAYAFVYKDEGSIKLYQVWSRSTDGNWKMEKDLDLEIIEGQGLLLFENDIYITGGTPEGSSALIINVNDWKIKKQTLPHEVFNHYMVIIDYKATIIGGYDVINDRLSTMMTYDKVNESWNVQPTILEKEDKILYVYQFRGWVKIA